jgi:murein DD-endopeptidase MepM/ murein hydrolase activator NlpD
VSLVRPITGPISQAFDGQFPWERPGLLRRDATAARGRRDKLPGGRKYAHIHLAIDYIAPTGTPVVAAHSGKVVAQFTDAFDGAVVLYLRVKVTPKFDLYAVYWHLRAGSFRQKTGTFARAGQAIAESGATGQVTGPHLHFELWRAPHGTALDDLYRKATRFDPQPFIDGVALLAIT